MPKTTKTNVVTSEIRLYFPIYTPSYVRFRGRAVSRMQWTVDRSIDGCFYLAYIERIFNKDGINSDCLVLKKELKDVRFLFLTYTLRVDRARIFSFDTSIAFLELNISFACDDPEDIEDICAELRRSNKYAICYGKKERGCLNVLAESILRGLEPYTLFDHIASCGETRADLFVTMIADQSVEALDFHAYRIANGMNSHYNKQSDQTNDYAMFPHVKWEISDRGVCNLGIRTDNERNNAFVNERWMSHSNVRYIVWFILALHQKYALYHFLNEIAENNDINNLKKIQGKIIFFNTKYRFNIISEEESYQRPYEMFCDVLRLQKQFDDIDDEVERISEYHETNSEKNTNLAMTIISVLCAVEVLKTCYDLLKVESIPKALQDAFAALTVGGRALYGTFLLVMAVALLILIPKSPLVRWIKAQIRRVQNFIFNRKLK
ncbi:MAG: hypothetical protein IJV98_05810 [Clostridia bacterium]|nr:hypothetical protein [Clostridia bacterium]